MENIKEMDPESLRLFFSLSLDLFCIATTDGYFKHVNESWTKLLGHSSKELVSKSFLEFVHPDDLEKTLDCLRAVGQGDDVTSFENRYRCRDGTYRHLRWKSRNHPEKDIVFAVARDVTEQKAFEERLHRGKLEAEAQTDYLHSLLSEVPALAAVLKGPDFVFEFANTEYCKLVGQRNVIGLPLAKVFPDLDGSIFNILKGVFRTGEKFIAQELPIGADWHGDGKKEVRHFTFVYSPLKNKCGEVVAVWCLAFEVTEKKKMEGRLQVSERMASLGTLAAGVAHEVNNPLAYLMLSLEMILAKIETAPALGSPDHQDIIEKMHSCELALERIRKIVQSLKSFSRNHEEKKFPVSVKNVVETTLPFVAHEMKHRATLRLEIEDVPLILGNDGQLSQVMINLLINAAHSIPFGQVDRNFITVSVRNSCSGFVEIVVADTGCGIPPGDLQKIFEPFFTSKALGEGTGLGLTMCHEIIASMGGLISVESKVGQGSQFKIKLPVIQETPLAHSEKVTKFSGTKESDRPLQHRILILDDEIEFAQELGSFLSHSFEVTVANRMEQGVAAVQTASFDLVISDIVMPEGTGIDFQKRISESQPRLAQNMIFITGGVTDPILRSVQSGLPQTIVEKPFRFAEIMEVIRKHLKASVDRSA